MLFVSAVSVVTQKQEACQSYANLRNIPFNQSKFPLFHPATVSASEHNLKSNLFSLTKSILVILFIINSLLILYPPQQNRIFASQIPITVIILSVYKVVQSVVRKIYVIKIYSPFIIEYNSIFMQILFDRLQMKKS